MGCESISSVELLKNGTMPWDRVWALTHSKTKFSSKKNSWLPTSSFLRGTIAPLFMAISIELDEINKILKLTHPNLPDLLVDLDNLEVNDDLISWVKPICPENAPNPASLYRVPRRGLTDTAYCSVSVLSTSSLELLSSKVGLDLDPRRFRGNFWFDGVEAFQELDWIGKELKVGSAQLKVVEPIERCNITKTSPINGERDAETLDALFSNFGHKNFGVYCQVIKSGNVSLGDKVTLFANP